MSLAVLGIILLIIVMHYIGDFLCQTEYMAINKSENIYALVSHTFVYTFVVTVPMLFLLPHSSTAFLFITFIAHSITDYYTSRINKKLYKKAQNTKNARPFFNMVGLDQVLHYTQLFTTYYFLC